MRRPAAAVLALALLAGACSGSSGVTAPTDTTTTTPPATTTTSPTTTTPTTTTTTAAVDVPALARSVLLVGLPGPDLDEATAAHLAGGGRGLVLFADNVEDAGQLRSLAAAAACAAGGEVLVAADEELGEVARLGDLVTPLPSTAEAQGMSALEIELTGQLLGEEMLALGVNVDLAPVVDVVQGPNPALEGRNLGSDPEVVAELGAAFLRGLGQAGVIAVPKHFPGHGRSTIDPHDEVSFVDAALEDLEAVDFPPFEAVFAAGAQAVMIGHPIYRAIDPNLPASLSPAVLTMLREGFGFDGVAITDSLSMEGVASGADPSLLAVMALAAGEDLLLVEDPAQVGPMVSAIVAAVARGDLPLRRLQEASARVLHLASQAVSLPCEA